MVTVLSAGHAPQQIEGRSPAAPPHGGHPRKAVNRFSTTTVVAVNALFNATTVLIDPGVYRPPDQCQWEKIVSPSSYQSIIMKR
jgi:hypothetical protein